MHGWEDIKTNDSRCVILGFCGKTWSFRKTTLISALISYLTRLFAPRLVSLSGGAVGESGGRIHLSVDAAWQFSVQTRAAGRAGMSRNGRRTPAETTEAHKLSTANSQLSNSNMLHLITAVGATFYISLTHMKKQNKINTRGKSTDIESPNEAWWGKDIWPNHCSLCRDEALVL